MDETWKSKKIGELEERIEKLEREVKSLNGWSFKVMRILESVNNLIGDIFDLVKK